jgi:hypothetical protein
MTKTLRFVLGLLGTLLASACAPAGQKAAGTPGELEVRSSLELQTAVAQEGDLATAVFHIENHTSNYILLRDLTYLADPQLQESASAAASWQLSQAGRLTYDSDGNEWTFDRNRKADRTASIFNTGLLVPGEGITIRTKFRLLSMPKYFQLLYFELPLERVRGEVYFEARQDREIRYRALVGQDLKSRLLPNPNSNVAGHRTVLFPFAERVQPSASIKPIKIESTLRPRSFSLADAIRRWGQGPADQHTYSSSLEGWILKRGAEFALVTRSTILPLPLLRQMDRTFYFIDSQEVGKIEIELQDDAVASVMQLELKYTVVKDKQPSRTRYCLFLPVSELPKFLGAVRGAQMAIDVEMTPEGGGRLLVIR